MPSHAAEDEPDRRDDEGSSTPGGEDSGESVSGRRRRREKKKSRPFWKELPILIVVALLLTFLIQQFLARVYMIPSGSMETTLHGCPGCTGDRILVDKLTYDFSDPESGEVIVFKGPQPWTENDSPTQPESSNAIAGFFQSVGSVFGLAPPDERDFVKRIIAVGGQTVECCDDQNRVLVDGKPLDEPYIHYEVPGEEQVEFEPVKVPEGSYWVMGDNRNQSSDSRYQGGGGVRGTVPEDNIIGKARLIVLPPSRWGGVSDHDPQEAVAMSAPAWQQGLPAGIGAAAAWPTVVLGRRVAGGVRKVVSRGR
ncbi:signal peptidase I [Amycolatopsis antarctica]|uniref:Signal peptidase I n=1 Tax=Amycolatopsis antarctica TaxID=1854586 RepID=A0A263D6S5_9PSEU|nr:signal peptidase I [Amycolatopsis antarctica]OZM74224.1 signal peptidase I [Amycolatopsis antarctica]